MSVGDSAGNFGSIDIDGGEILSLLIEPGAKAAIEISRISPSLRSAQIFDLQLYQVLQSSVRVKAEPWLKAIVGHHLFTDSPFLSECLERRSDKSQSGDIFYHFSVALQGGGSIDVVACGFSFTLKKLIHRAGLSSS